MLSPGQTVPASSSLSTIQNTQLPALLSTASTVCTCRLLVAETWIQSVHSRSVELCYTHTIHNYWSNTFSHVWQCSTVTVAVLISDAKLDTSNAHSLTIATMTQPTLSQHSRTMVSQSGQGPIPPGMVSQSGQGPIPSDLAHYKYRIQQHVHIQCGPKKRSPYIWANYVFQD